jgi:hypothetical protein
MIARFNPRPEDLQRLQVGPIGRSYRVSLLWFHSRATVA